MVGAWSEKILATRKNCSVLEQAESYDRESLAAAMAESLGALLVAASSCRRRTVRRADARRPDAA
jgi:hypothetical protein